MSTQAKNLGVVKGGAKDTVTGPWEQALDTLREWDPQFAQACFKMTTNPWTSEVLPRKLVRAESVWRSTSPART
jgi:hypothetical protein